MESESKLQFTHREQFLVSYYRDRWISRAWWNFSGDIGWGLGALIVFSFSVWRENWVSGCVAFAILLYRIFYLVYGGQTWNGDLKSISDKCDAEIQRLGGRQNERKTAEPGATDNPDGAQRFREDH